MKRTEFLLDGAPHGPLRGDVYLPDPSRGAPVVVGCHGFKGFKDWGFWPELGRRMANRGVVLVTFNLSGSGIGEDPQSFTELDRFQANTIGKEVLDLGAVLEAVVDRDVPIGGADVRRLGVLGHSRGGGVAVVRAGRDPRVRSLVTWAAVARFDRHDEETRRAWRETGYLEVPNTRTGQIFRVGVELLNELEERGDALRPDVAARRLRIPTLIIHGTEDEAVPVADAQALALAADPGLRTLARIEGAGHTFGAAHPLTDVTPELDRVFTMTVDWFLNTL